MKKNFLIFSAFFLVTFFVFGNNIEVFFAQDDFILISKFSQNSLQLDFKNIFSFSETHFRPIHNLYFLVLGNLFGTHYSYYHMVSLLVHAVSAFLVYKIAKNLIGGNFAPFVSAIFYLVNPSHFVSLYWISGSAVEIGFVFFCISFLFWIRKKFLFSTLSILLSMLTSEAFVLSFVVILAYEYLMGDVAKNRLDIIKFSALSILYGLIRFLFLSPQQALDSYKFIVSLATFSSLKYYILRSSGISEMRGDFVLTLVLIVFYGILIKRFIDLDLDIKKTVFFILMFVVGLFPFVLLSDHLSPHYMNLSIFALSLIVSLSMKQRTKFNVVILIVFLVVSAINVHRMESASWVIIRSRIAEAYIRQIEASEEPAPNGAPIVFSDNRISSSLEAYISLGGGKALDFWFKDKGFRYCFTEFESCKSMP